MTRSQRISPSLESNEQNAAAPESLDAAAYWERRLRQHPGLAGVGYLRLGLRYNRWLYRLRSELFRTALARWNLAGRAMHVIDIGSGTGHYVTEWLLAGASSVTATDITEVVIQRLTESLPGVPSRRLDIATPSLATSIGRYDVVSAMDVLFHIVDDAAYERAIQNCFALCRPGGYFVFSENFLHGERVATGHMVSRTHADVLASLRQAGFVPLDRRPMFVLMNYPIDTRGKVKRFLWSAIMAPAMLSDRIGGALGALLYPLEKKLLDVMTEGPSTELMLCRRPASSPSS